MDYRLLKCIQNYYLLSLFFLFTSCSPGPNNIVASHSGFNHGVKKTIPLMLGVIFGFTSMLSLVNFGLINIFKLYPIIQKILVFTGSAFLVYLAYRISFSKSSNQKEKLEPVKFIETFLFQFLNPKGVIASIILVSTYINPGETFVSYTTQIIFMALIVSVTSITLWTFLGKFFRKFATNQKFINYFNYAMSLLLLTSIITFYL